MVGSQLRQVARKAERDAMTARKEASERQTSARRERDRADSLLESVRLFAHCRAHTSETERSVD
jgi:hypothetical protein